MNYGFTPDGERLLEKAREADERSIQNAINAMQAQDDIEAEYASLGVNSAPIFDFNVVNQAQLFETPDNPERFAEPQYAVTAHRTIQNVHDNEPGLAGELTAGLTYDPVEVKYDVMKVESSDRNYNRFAPPETTFDDKLNAQAEEYRRQQNEAFEQDMKTSPLYRRSVQNKYS